MPDTTNTKSDLEILTQLNADFSSVATDEEKSMLKRSGDMKTLLVIALAAAALTIGTATVAPISGTAVAGGGGPDRWCGAIICPPKKTHPGTHRGY